MQLLKWSFWAGLSSLSLLGCSALQSPTLVSDLEFKDPSFKQCVTKQGIEVLNQITKLDCNHAYIDSIDEIQYMPSLREIILIGNNISTLDVTHLPRLNRLIVPDNQISSINLSQNAELVDLNLSGNQVNAIDVSKNLKLRTLYAYKIPLSQIDVSKQRQLTTLGLSRHQLSTVDVSHNSELTTLTVSGGVLESIDVSNNPKLRYLYLSSNQLTDIDLSENTSLHRVRIRNNQLTELLLPKNSELRELKADYNQLTHIDFSQNRKLKHIEVNNNKLTEMDLSQQPELDKLVGFNNPLTSLNVVNAAGMSLLSLEGTPYAQAQALLEQPETSSISHTLHPVVSVTEAGVIVRKGEQWDVLPTSFLMPKVGDYFGIRYTVTLSKEEKTKHRSTHQFPITVRVTHPKIVDPQTGKGFTVSSWTDTMFKHDKNLAIWHFSAENAIVTGKWTMEILYRDSVVAQKSFMLTDVEKDIEESKTATQKQLQQVINDGDKVLCSQQKYRACFEFDTTSQCELALQPFKTTCQAAVLMSKKESPNKQGIEAITQYFTEYTACMSKQYIKTTDLSSKKVGACISK